MRTNKDVEHGGTGVYGKGIGFTAFAPLCGGTTTTGPLQDTGALTDGQLLIGQTGALPLPKTISGDFTINSSGLGAFASSVIGGTYTQFTVTASGRVTAVGFAPTYAGDGTTISASSPFSIISCPWSDLTGTPTTLAGYGLASADQSLGSNKLTNVTDPTSAQDAATKNYVDTQTANIAEHVECRAASITALTENSYTNNGGVGDQMVLATLTVDGITAASNDRLLIKNQASAAHNGIWTVTTVGIATLTLTRATDFDQEDDGIDGAVVYVKAGTVNNGTRWICGTAGTITWGTTTLNWSQFTGATYAADETTLHLSGTTFSILSTYTGQTTIVTVGTVATGTWQATIIDTARGGTGEDNSTGGTANTFWARPNGSSGAASYRTIVAADLPAVSIFPITTDTYAATITIDLSASNWHQITLATNAAPTIYFTGDKDGQGFSVLVLNGGNNTITWASNYIWWQNSATAPTPTNLGGTYDLYSFKRVSPGFYLGTVAYNWNQPTIPQTTMPVMDRGSLPFSLRVPPRRN